MSEPSTRSVGYQRPRDTIRIFLSFPKTAVELVDAAEKGIKKKFDSPTYRERASALVVRWDSENQVVWEITEDRNDAIYRTQGHPRDADLLLVMLVSDIGPGTMKEIADRLLANRSVHVFMQDTPPAQGNYRDGKESYKAALYRYDSMHDWLKDPFILNGDIRDELPKKNLIKNRVNGTADCERLVGNLIEYTLNDRYNDSSRTRGGSTEIYAGLRPLTEEHDRYFFGRAQYVESIVGSLTNDQPSHVIVAGSSGVGKSSLLAAGVMPALKRHPCASGSTVRFLDRNKRSHLIALVHALHEWHPDPIQERALLERFRRSPEKIPLNIHHILEGLGEQRLFLFIDQFERCYPNLGDIDTKHFFLALGEIIKSNKVTLIIGHRSDQLQTWTDGDFFATERGSTVFSFFTVPTMARRRDLESVIIGPASAAGIEEPEPELVEALLQDCHPDRNSLPLLALAIHILYKRCRPGRMTLKAYKDLRRIGGIIEKSLSLAEEQLGERISELPILFDLLIAFGSEGFPISQSADKELLRASGVSDQTIEDLEENALLTSTEGGTTFAHEAYFEVWPRLKDWLSRSAPDLKELSELTNESHRWNNKNRSSSYVLMGERLPDAEDLMKRLTSAQLVRLKQRGDFALISDYIQASAGHVAKLSEIRDQLPDSTKSVFDKAMGSIASKNIPIPALEDMILESPDAKESLTSRIRKGLEEPSVIPEFLTHIPKGYRNIKLVQEVATVSSDLVNENVNLLRNLMGSALKVKDGPAQQGDVVTVTGSEIIFDLEPAGTEPKQNLLRLKKFGLGPGGASDLIQQKLLGKQARDVVQFELLYPMDFHSKDVAGKRVLFSFRIDCVEAKSLIDFTDGMVREKLGHENKAALMVAIRKMIDAQLEAASQQRLKRKLLDHLDDANKFVAPKQLVEIESENLWKAQLAELKLRGLSLDVLGKPIAEFKSELRDLADRRVRLGILLCQLTAAADAAGAKLSDADIEGAIDDKINSMHSLVVQDRELFLRDVVVRAGMRGGVIEDRVIDWVLSKCHVVRKEVPAKYLLRELDIGTSEDL